MTAHLSAHVRSAVTLGNPGAYPYRHDVNLASSALKVACERWWYCLSFLLNIAGSHPKWKYMSWRSVTARSSGEPARAKKRATRDKHASSYTHGLYQEKHHEPTEGSNARI
eukprot:121938-Chlamydomonas_euryale.AAC.2